MHKSPPYIWLQWPPKEPIPSYVHEATISMSHSLEAGIILLTTNFSSNVLHWNIGSINPNPHSWGGDIITFHATLDLGFTSDAPHKKLRISLCTWEITDLKNNQDERIYHIEDRSTWLAIMILPANDKCLEDQNNNFFFNDINKGAISWSFVISIPTRQPRYHIDLLCWSHWKFGWGNQCGTPLFFILIPMDNSTW